MRGIECGEPTSSGGGGGRGGCCKACCLEKWKGSQSSKSLVRCLVSIKSHLIPTAAPPSRVDFVAPVYKILPCSSLSPSGEKAKEEEEEEEEQCWRKSSMEVHGRVAAREEKGELRRGPWTTEEDIVLVNYIAVNGEGKWNSLARCAGLRRTGKSCRLRWLNYLRPNVRRGNITPEEQLLILELHSRWGNRWSKIAQYLPGRTDNEIKNYWRTRVQKHAKQLKCDVDSQKFKDIMRYLWMPRLLERISVASAAAASETPATCSDFPISERAAAEAKPSPENSSAAGSSSTTTSVDSLSMQLSPQPVSGGDLTQPAGELWTESLMDAVDFPELEQIMMWPAGENLWSVDDIWSMQQQF